MAQEKEIDWMPAKKVQEGFDKLSSDIKKLNEIICESQIEAAKVDKLEAEVKSLKDTDSERSAVVKEVKEKFLTFEGKFEENSKNLKQALKDQDEKADKRDKEIKAELKGNDERSAQRNLEISETIDRSFKSMFSIIGYDGTPDGEYKARKKWERVLSVQEEKDKNAVADKKLLRQRLITVAITFVVTVLAFGAKDALKQFLH